MQLLHRTLVAGTLAVGASDCGTTGSEPGTPVFEAGALILSDSMTAVDASPLPCCARDSAGVRITTVAGSLLFYSAARYEDSVFTPGGMKPRACVQEIPNGAFLALNQLVTLANGSSYLLLPCSSGVYRVVITEGLRHSDGTTTERQVLRSAGAYTWEPNRLSLTEQGTMAHPPSAMSAASITLMLNWRSYSFVAVPRH